MKNYYTKKCFLSFFILICLFDLFYFSKIKSTIKTENNNSNKIKNKNEFTNTISTANKSKMTLTTKSCNPLCRECSINDLNYCTICQPNIIFFQYNCYTKCPEGFYIEKEEKQCKPCHTNCPVCWGPNPDMCGPTEGINTSVIALEEEIKNFLMNYTFTRQEIEKWLNSLKIILSKDNEEKILTEEDIETLSGNEIYNTHYPSIELPVGSFSTLEGVFIPIPSYMSLNKKLVNSHWIYKKGQWDGQRWVSQFFPRLPTFIRIYGQKNKIYYENKGYWIFDEFRNWYFIKNEKFIEQLKTVNDVLASLNTIKIDVK